MGPKGMTEEEVAYWDGVIKEWWRVIVGRDFEGAGWEGFIRVGRV